MIKRTWQLFALGLWLGATIFGGLNSAYPVIRSKAQEMGWMTGEDVDALYATAVFLPGPSFLNTWGAVGMRTAGWPGAVAGEVGLILPSFVLVCTLPLLKHVPVIATHLDGIARGTVWATGGLLLAAGLQGIKGLKGPLVKWLVVPALVLLFLGTSALVVLGLAIVFGVAQGLVAQRREGV